MLQIVIPFRHLAMSGDTLWTENGENFAWRMKLRDKQGFALFVAEDRATGHQRTYHPENHLNGWQTFQLAGDPEMLLQFAHIVRDRERAQGRDVRVFVHAFVSLNGRERQLFVVPTRDLSTVEANWWANDWIVPLQTPFSNRSEAAERLQKAKNKHENAHAAHP